MRRNSCVDESTCILWDPHIIPRLHCLPHIGIEYFLAEGSDYPVLSCQGVQGPEGDPHALT